MKILVRILAAVAIAALTVGPVSAATAPSDALTTVAQAVSTGSVSGTFVDSGGTPVANASVKLAGPSTYTTTTDARGSFAFAAVKPGIYIVTATKAGYNGAEVDDLAVVAGTNSIVNASMSAVTFNTTIHEIVRVTAHRGTVFNTSTASSAIVSAQDFQDQAQTQVAKVLDETPGIVIDHPGTSATYASPGAITFPSIRGSLGFETASLIDGHPLAVGLYGDYVTSFLNSYFLQTAEVVKGPGAAAPNVNYAIGGLVNFRTKDPTRVPTLNAQFSTNTNGGQTMNLLYTGTTSNGKLGWVLGFGQFGQTGPLDNTNNYWDVPSGVLVNGIKYGFTANQVPNSGTNGIWNNTFADNTQVLACCFPVTHVYNNRTEIVKLKYNLSSATTLTGSYLGSQTWTDQNGNHVYGYNQILTPCGPTITGANPCSDGASTSYQGGLTPGQRYMTWQNIFAPVGEWEVNNEPIFQGELRTTLGHDTFLARYYGASINRLQYNALDSPSQSFSMTNTLNGAYCTGSNTAGHCSTNWIYYNDTPATLTFDPNVNGKWYCVTNGSKSLNWNTNPTKQNTGSTPQLCKYNAAGALVTSGAYATSRPAAFYNSFFFASTEEDKIHGTSFEYDHPFADGADNVTVSYDRNTFNTHSYSPGDPRFADSVPDGSGQTIGTLLMRGTFQFGPKWNAVVGGYVNTYDTGWSSDGGFTFNHTRFTHNDLRLGLTYRPSSNTIYRFAAGSAIAPPYLGLYGVGSPPTCGSGALYCTSKNPSNALLPETSFGYDVGGSSRFGGDLSTEFSWDAYTSTLWNQYSSQSFVSCPYFDTGDFTCQSAASSTTVPLITSQATNLTNVRYSGLEMQLQRRPTVGFGYKAQGALLRAYPYNLPPCFYSNNPVTSCNALNVNLAVIPNQNFNGSGTSGTPGSGSQGVNNHNIPYAQAYGELSYRFASGAYASFGEQLYGHHNSLNLPAFWVANATLRVPMGKNLNVQGSVANVFNIYPNAWSTLAAGVPIQLVNNESLLTNANSIGPRTFTLMLNFRTGGTP